MKTAVGLSVKNISWAIPSEQRIILYPLSFDLAPGRILGVLGPNGAGKSSLLKLLYRFQSPSTGSIVVDGTDIWSISARKVARTIAAVLQEQPSDFALTVNEIVSLGRTPYHKWFGGKNHFCDSQIVKQTLERLNLLDFEDRQLGTLSGGERQRVMVARALAQQPSLLILDEPTNHLDIRQQLEVLALIQDLPVTIVTSLHDLNMATSACDDVLLLKDGHSLGFGEPSSVLTESTITEAFCVKTRQEMLVPSKSKHITFHLK
jgi:iron complex transport system ATP-binding protein